MNDLNIPAGLESLVFDNRFVHELPGDESTDIYPRQVHNACYSPVIPTAVSAPELLLHSPDLLDDLGLGEQTPQSDLFLQTFSGNQLLPGMQPYAMCYGGHQFGNWAGQLGDGRAINLGEVITSTSDRWVLQLKGAGPTPYSRSADGLAVVRSSVREFLCSEAMHYLGVPTTRALSLISTGEQVMRDMFYDGNANYEPGAVVCRVAPSFIRFGNFQLLAARQDFELLRQLTEYTIRTDYPELYAPDEALGPAEIITWFAEVCRRTADMVAHWMRVGFVHGVMNTDNMSILGLTIDYGPYGWVEDYDLDWTPNTTDAQGKRYRYGAQPAVASWNLAQLANALHPLLELGEDVEPLQAALDVYGTRFTQQWHATMTRKLGFESFHEEVDPPIFESLSKLMGELEADMTCFYRSLADISADEMRDTQQNSIPLELLECLYRTDDLRDHDRAALAEWLRGYGERLGLNHGSEEERRTIMNSVNPRYVLRNYLAQLAIDKVEEGDNSLLCELFEVLRNPYDDQPGKEMFAEMRPEWARHRAGCSMLSCSS